ncbi:MAG: hypothetical protein AMXMBFR16_03680 [Candidatus Uhrbacteria bacterium]|jgi:hypothetical protein
MNMPLGAWNDTPTILAGESEESVEISRLYVSHLSPLAPILCHYNQMVKGSMKQIS